MIKETWQFARGEKVMFTGMVCKVIAIEDDYYILEGESGGRYYARLDQVKSK